MSVREHADIFKKSMKLLWSLSRPHFLCLIFGSMLKAVIPYVPIYFSARLIDSLYEGETLSRILLYVCLTVGIVFGVSLLKTVVQEKSSAAMGEVYRNEWWMYSKKAMQMAYESIEDQEVNLHRARIRMESQTGYNLFYLNRYTEGYIQYITQILASVSLTASFFRADAIPVVFKIALLLGVFLTVWIGVLTAGKVERIRIEFFDSMVDVNTLFGKYEDYVGDYSSGKDIRLYDMADSLGEHYNILFLDRIRKGILATCKQSMVSLADTAANQGLKLGLYLILLYGALEGGISVGSIAQYVSSVMLLLGACSGMVTTTQRMLLNHKYLQNFFAYFEIPNNMYQGSLTVEKRDDNQYDVEFRDVSFRYPGAEDYALRHLNLKFKVGEKMAVVGMNGSGKTTFIKLLCRLYDPTEGEILLNGVNIKKYDYDEYMSIFSLVFQDFQMFSMSLGENVAAGRSYDASTAEDCIRKAGLGERFDQMPEGLNTYLYQKYDKAGIEISGGEAQKIALARALYKDAPFLVLDEPTAALDPISEYEVYNSFNKIAGDKTAIYISHRLASCRFCDKIAVFHQGELIQLGRHEELLAVTDGKYQELWNAQAQYYTV